MLSRIQGECLCGAVRFEIENRFQQFHLCHCTQCQKMTGSAHAANLFTDSDNIYWISGKTYIKRFDLPGRDFSNAFCERCGGHLPYVSKTGKYLIVPAGSLNSAPHLAAQDHIFWCERADWYEESVMAIKYNQWPE